MMSSQRAACAVLPGEVDVTAVRSQGAGGQNVNKVASAIHLRFDIRASSLPAELKQRLLDLPDRRITGDGVIVIKAQRHRNREQNLDDAMHRLQTLVDSAAVTQRPRLATRPTRGSKVRRLDSKTRRSRAKSLRSRIRGVDD